jgi:prepilin-type N-terminal cleavage/methylation domain-containing protein
MKIVPGKKEGRGGFSLIELLIVLLLLAIIAAVTVPATGRFLGTISDRQKRQDIMATLRFARLMAISKGEPVDLRLGENGKTIKLSGPIDKIWSFPFEEGEELSLEPEIVTFYPEGIASIGTLIYRNNRRVAAIVVDPLTALPKLAVAHD